MKFAVRLDGRITAEKSTLGDACAKARDQLVVGSHRTTAYVWCDGQVVAAVHRDWCSAKDIDGVFRMRQFAPEHCPVFGRDKGEPRQ